ncbi:uncharacterized protein [Littorina saxatilis]|uniref:Uncharacterized protein n=1 Tax=Littorina saxatilis TaxID=31220 RepID=A0AAN9GB77_9CAEN
MFGNLAAPKEDGGFRACHRSGSLKGVNEKKKHTHRSKMYKHPKANPIDPVSRNCVNATNRNAFCKTTLQKELDVLEKERARQLKSIHHEAKQFRQHVGNRSPSPGSPGSRRPVSAALSISNGSKSNSLSPLRHSMASSAKEERDTSGQNSPDASSRSTSPSGSLLTRRKPANSTRPENSKTHEPQVRQGEHVFITHVGSNVLQPVGEEELNALQQQTRLRPTAVNVEHCNVEKLNALQQQQQTRLRLTAVIVEHCNVPQIVVSDETDRPLSAATRELPQKAAETKGGGGGGGEMMNQPQEKEKIPATLSREDQRKTQRSVSEESGSKKASDLHTSPSLDLPVQRPRRNSMSQIHVLPSIFEKPKRRPSYCPDPSTLSSELLLPESPRARSSSFSGITPARRRGSIVETWGSVSECNKPLFGHSRGRRTSVDLSNMVRDLMFGVQHAELMAGGGRRASKSLTEKEWQELKKCRYLRMPSRDNSEEDLSGEP